MLSQDLEEPPARGPLSRPGGRTRGRGALSCALGRRGRAHPLGPPHLGREDGYGAGEPCPAPWGSEAASTLRAPPYPGREDAHGAGEPCPEPWGS